MRVYGNHDTVLSRKLWFVGFSFCEHLGGIVLATGQEASHEPFIEVQRGLTALGIPFQLNPRLVLGLDYYSYTAYEITSDQLGA